MEAGHPRWRRQILLPNAFTNGTLFMLRTGFTAQPPGSQALGSTHKMFCPEKAQSVAVSASSDCIFSFPQGKGPQILLLLGFQELLTCQKNTVVPVLGN